MWTWNFWRQALERAVKTFAQSALAMLTGDGMGLLDVNWSNVASVSLFAALISVLFSIVSLGVGPEKESPSVVKVD